MEAGAGTSEVLREREECRAEARRYVKGEKKKQIPRRYAPRNDNEDKGRRKTPEPRKRGADPGPQKAGPTLQKGWSARLRIVWRHWPHCENAVCREPPLG